MSLAPRLLVDAHELVGGNVVAITALGREMVVFRGADGVAGVLHAFCPHLGTHLGHGGRVEGNTLVCPYHEWAFDARGKNLCIPYCKRGGPTGMVGVKRVDTKAYEVCEVAGMVFFWCRLHPLPCLQHTHIRTRPIPISLPFVRGGCHGRGGQEEGEEEKEEEGRDAEH